MLNSHSNRQNLLLLMSTADAAVVMVYLKEAVAAGRVHSS